jgi:hypothetical protein
LRHVPSPKNFSSPLAKLKLVAGGFVVAPGGNKLLAQYGWVFTGGKFGLANALEGMETQRLAMPNSVKTP